MQYESGQAVKSRAVALVEAPQAGLSAARPRELGQRGKGRGSTLQQTLQTTALSKGALIPFEKIKSIFSPTLFHLG